MQNIQTDKVILDLADNETLAEAVSRMEPGEKRKFSGVISMDEVANKIGTFSIEKAQIGDSAIGEEDDESGDEGEGEPTGEKSMEQTMDEPAVMEVMGKK